MEILHRLIRPANSNNAPLIVLLHGYGSDMHDLFSFTSDIPENFIVVSFQAPIPLPWGGWAWYEINFTDAGKFTNDEQARSSMHIILDNIQLVCEENNLSNDHIILCGFSQGAILSYALGWNHPDIFSHLICLSGYLDKKLLKNEEVTPFHLKQKFYISHGREDVVIPIEWAKAGKDFLISKGLHVQWHEYASGHGLCPENYHSMMEFIRSIE